MFDVKISEDFLVDTEGTSDGTQLKFFKNGYWYKEDNEGCEGEVEYLVSKLLTFSTLKPEDYVIYEQGKINGKSGCRSKSFLTASQSFITLERLHGNLTGELLFEKIKEFQGVSGKASYVIKFCRDTVGLDLTDYFRKVFTLDFIVLNEDRHFHNLGIIMDAEDSYKPAPIFDNGKSLLNCNPSVNRRLSLEENIKRVVARPFSGSHKATYEYFGKGFDLNIDDALQWLNQEPDSFYKSVLLYRLNKILENSSHN